MSEESAKQPRLRKKQDTRLVIFTKKKKLYRTSIMSKYSNRLLRLVVMRPLFSREPSCEGM